MRQDIRKSNILIDHDRRTFLLSAVACKDVATKAATMILTMGASKRGVRAIEVFLKMMLEGDSAQKRLYRVAFKITRLNRVTLQKIFN
jgi:hypothetical protein